MGVVVVVVVAAAAAAAIVSGSRTDIVSSFTLLSLRSVVGSCSYVSFYIWLYKCGSSLAVCTCNFRIHSFHTLLGCSRLILCAGVEEVSGVHLSSSFHIKCPTHLKSSLFSTLFLCIQPLCSIILCSTNFL